VSSLLFQEILEVFKIHLLFIKVFSDNRKLIC